MDAEWMRLALELAALGEGDVHPNPLVGAAVVREERVVGRGYHRRFGGPHAELFALDEAGNAARGATLYVTLEPCCHHGKTPPCTDRIITAGIRRVVVAARDPNPEIDGRGIACLRAAGIEVVEGILSDEAEHQNEIFFTFIRRRRPFVQLKLAVSLDGRIATKTGDSRWISFATSSGRTPFRSSSIGVAASRRPPVFSMPIRRRSLSPQALPPMWNRSSARAVHASGDSRTVSEGSILSA
jgi:diaminohydroxyphosphoribosylaminopyrimidine deaminase/5-amino-6-(5-phosphoribosylamino)uracil reductase